MLVGKKSPTPEMMAVREKVYKAIMRMDSFTVPELVEDLEGVDQQEVRRALRFFEKAGIVSRQGKKQTAISGGRPAIIWKVER